MADFGDFLRLKWYFQALIVVGAAGALLGLFWYQFLTPISAEIEGKQGQLNSLNTQIAQAVQRQMQLAEIRAESEALQEQLDALKSILPLERETDAILREVDSTAKDASMVVIAIAPRPIVAQDVYSTWSWDFRVQSTYHNMGRFLDAIRRLRRIVNISGINMTAGGNGVTTTVDATYTATTFVYNEEAPLPAN